MPGDRLDELLERWRTAPPPLARDLGAEVRARVHVARPSWWAAVADALRRPALGFASIVVLVALLGLETWRARDYAERNAELARRYVQLIDPQAAAPVTAEALAAELAWMRDNLRLTPGQFARIKALHEQSSPRLLALAAQVARMREEFAAFEQMRRTRNEVDFVEFARFVAERRDVDRDCTESTRGLIAATAAVMDERQRERYLALFGPAVRTAGQGLN